MKASPTAELKVKTLNRYFIGRFKRSICWRLDCIESSNKFSNVSNGVVKKIHVADLKSID